MNPMPIIWQYVIHEVMRISSLDELEFVRIVGTYHNITSNRTTDTQLKNRGYTEAQLKEIEKNRKVQNVGVQSCGLNFTGSLDNYDCPRFNYYCLLFENYERGVMPFEGTITEQPPQIIEIFGILQSLRLEYEERTRKEIERKNKKRK